MKYRRSVAGLSIFLVLALVVSWMVLTTLRRVAVGPTNTYSALFTDVSGLKEGDDVRVAGVRVGRVDSIDLVGNLAKVTFRLQRDQALYTNTIASVTYQNVIGQRYVGLAPGSSGDKHRLRDGDQIPVDRTNPSFDIGYVLNGFEPLFTVLDPKQVDNLTEAVVRAFQGDTGSILQLITQTSALAQSLEEPDELLGRVITSLNTVVTNLAGQTGSLQRIISQSRDILTALDNRRDALVASMGSINATMSRLATITSNISPDLQEFINRQPGVAAYINANPDRLAYMAANLPYMLKGMARTAQEGTYSDLYMCNLNATIFAFIGRVIPGMVKLASPGNVIRNTPVCR